MENFESNAAIGKDSRAEPSGGESVRMVPGRVFHFWGKRVLFPVGGLDGVYVEFKARVIADDAATAGDVDRAAYLAAASADYWKSQAAPPGQVNILNEDIAIPPFRLLTDQWQLFSMNTLGTTPHAPSPH